MPNTNRRNVLRAGLAFVAHPSAILHLGCAPAQENTSRSTEASPDNHSVVSGKISDPTIKGNAMQIQYLEIVTKDVEAVCATYSQLHGVRFGDSDQNLGGARTAKLVNGGMLGVRAPLRETEEPVVRPYLLVQDIQAAVDTAAKSGAVVALPPMELPGHGTCAVVIQGGIESGLWQL